jgi:spore coat protein CotH
MNYKFIQDPTLIDAALKLIQIQYIEKHIDIFNQSSFAPIELKENSKQICSNIRNLIESKWKQINPQIEKYYSRQVGGGFSISLENQQQFQDFKKKSGSIESIKTPLLKHLGKNLFFKAFGNIYICSPDLVCSFEELSNNFQYYMNDILSLFIDPKIKD